MTDTQFASLVNQHPAHQQLTTCLDIVQDALDDLKAKNITVLDVADMTEVMERIVIAEGTSVSYTHLRAHETGRKIVCRLLLEKKKII